MSKSSLGVSSVSSQCCNKVNAYAQLTGSGTQPLPANNAAPEIRDLGNLSENGGLFSTTGPGQLQYDGTSDADVRITYHQASRTTTNNRSTARHAIYINGVEQVAARTYSYHRTGADGENTTGASLIVTVSPGDVIDLRSREDNAGDTITGLNDHAALIIEHLGDV